MIYKTIKPVIYFLFCINIVFPRSVFSQSVGIGTDNPNSSAILDITSTSQGVLFPRMTTTQRQSISTPSLGLMIFNLDDQCIDVFDGVNWIKNCGLKIFGTAPDPSTYNAWSGKANFGGGQRIGAVAFTIGGKGYVGTGTDASMRKNDFWEYDTLANTWAQKANFGGGPRTEAIGFGIGSKGYLGLGSDATTAFKKDFWEYDPSNNTWTIRDSFIGSPRAQAFAFNIGTKGYVGAGYTTGNILARDFYEYDPASNLWTIRDSFPTVRRTATGLAINNKGYAGLGIGSFGPVNDFWEYDPQVNDWIQKANFTGGARFRATGFSIGSKGYMGMGIDGPNVRKNDFWEYNPITNTWIQRASFVGTPRQDAFGFGFNNKGYIGGGIDGLIKSDFWQYRNDSISVQLYSSLSANTSGNSITDGRWTLQNGNIYSETQGNVGIGNKLPNNKLSVIGNSDIAGNLALGAMSTNSNNRLTVIGNTDVTGNLGVGISNSINKLSVVGNANVTGNLGLGTVTPSSRLSVVGRANIDSLAIGIAIPTNRLSVNGKANITDSLAIGAAIPTSRLSVNGDIDLSGEIKQENFQYPTLLNSWSNYGTEHAPASFYKDKEGRVHLTGLIKDGGAFHVFTLPVGYRPSTSKILIFTSITSTGTFPLDIYPDGRVEIGNLSNWVSLSGISFRAD